MQIMSINRHLAGPEYAAADPTPPKLLFMWAWTTSDFMMLTSTNEYTEWTCVVLRWHLKIKQNNIYN